MTVCKHSDCINYENVDVTKGICLQDECFVQFDGESCPRFGKKPRCKFCSKYQEGTEDGLGNCTGLEDGEHWISGEMIAVTCEQYEERVHG